MHVNRFVALLCLSVFTTLPVPAKAESTIVETAINAGSFKTLVAAIQAADLAETLNGPGPFTVFAPTDEGFSKLPPGTIESLLKTENKPQLSQILTYHVVAGRVPASEVLKLSSATTIQGQRVDIDSSGGVRVDNANVVQTDIMCGNGIIHVIDEVLLPESKSIPEIASEAGTFNTLLAAANAAGLVPTLSGTDQLTVFAPTDEAFTALPKGTVASLLKPENQLKLAEILKYHVIPGRVYSEDALSIDTAVTVAGPSIKITATDGGANINSARLLATDIEASNGVIHVIDRVLLPSEAPVTHSQPVMSARPSFDSQRSIARETLRDAIAHGVPVFNAGHHGECSRIYMRALQTVAGMPDCGLSSSTMNQVEQTLQSCRQMQSVTDQAWSLRRRMDQVIMEL